MTLLLWASAFVAIRHLGGTTSPPARSRSGGCSSARSCLGAVALSRGSAPAHAAASGSRSWRSACCGSASTTSPSTPASSTSTPARGDADPGLPGAGRAAGGDVPPRAVHAASSALGLALAFGGVALIGAVAAPARPTATSLGRGAVPARGGRLLRSAWCCRSRWSPRLPALHVTWLACTVGAVVCLPFAGQLVDDTRDASGVRHLVGRLPRLFPTAIAFTTYAFALRHMTASSLGVTTYLVPPMTILMGWLFLGETPPGMAYVGGVLALVGVAVARRKPRRREDCRGAEAAQPESRGCHAAAVNIVADVLVGLVAALHLYFLVLEMFLWTTPTGRGSSALDAGLRRGVQGAGGQPGPLQRLPGRRPRLGPGLRPDRREGLLPGLRGRRRGLRRRHRQQADPVVQAVPAALGAGGGRAQLTPRPEPRQAGRGAARSRPGDLPSRQVSASSRTCWSSITPVGELVRLRPLSAYPRRRETARDGALPELARTRPPRPRRGGRRRGRARRCASAVASPRPRTSGASHE